MTRRFLISGLSLALFLNGQTFPILHAATPVPPAVSRQVEKPKVYPLALSDSFSFGKVKTFNYELSASSTSNPMIQFERQRMGYGHVSREERLQREGTYYQFWWKNQRPAKLTVRFEYRQANLGSFVQAKEVDYDVPKGTHSTKFEVTGDEYHDDGRVIAWRALLIENGKIVALTQSALWH